MAEKGRRRKPKQDRRSIKIRLAMCKIGIRSLAKIDGFKVVRLELEPDDELEKGIKS